MSKSKPKPCPFCGYRESTHSHVSYWPGGPYLFGWHRVCPRCRASGPGGYDVSKAGATRAWNRRVKGKDADEQNRN